MKNKDWDANLTSEQNYILKQEGTEPPGSSPLNNEKREGTYHCAGCGIKLLSPVWNLIADWLAIFLNHFQCYLKQKLITWLVIQEQNIIVKIVKDIMDICLMMAKPTGKRYCNNGTCLVFKPKKWKNFLFLIFFSNSST